MAKDQESQGENIGEQVFNDINSYMIMGETPITSGDINEKVEPTFTMTKTLDGG